MAKVLIGSLGVRLNLSRYMFPDGSKGESRFFIRLFAEYVKPDKVILLLTQEAESTYWSAIQDEFHASLPSVELQMVGIPRGSNEAELWLIFAKLADLVADKDELYIDITNGFRSIPIIFMSAVEYLRRAKDIVINDIVYGAYDSTLDETKPMFRLKLFATLTEWANAVAAFRQTGDATLLHRLIDKHDLGDGPLTVTLRRIAKSLQNFSESTNLVRPIDIMDAASILNDYIDQFIQDYDTYIKQHGQETTVATVFPEVFISLLEEVRNSCLSFALSKQQTKNDVKHNLQGQLAVIQWYGQHDRLLPVAVIAYEWITTWAMMKVGIATSKLFLFDQRQDFIKKYFNASQGKNPCFLSPDIELPSVDKKVVVALWTAARDARHDLAHANYSRQPMPPSQLREKIKLILSQIDRLGAAL